MNEKEMIEKMAKDTGCCDYPQRDCSKCWCLEERECSAYAYAKTYYEQGYRKIPEGSVVLSKEENDINNKFIKYLQRRIDELNEYSCNVYKQARKKTAKEILRDIKYEIEDRNGAMLEEDLSVDATILQEVLNEIAKQYGVEVKE